MSREMRSYGQIHRHKEDKHIHRLLDNIASTMRRLPWRAFLSRNSPRPLWQHSIVYPICPKPWKTRADWSSSSGRVPWPPRPCSTGPTRFAPKIQFREFVEQEVHLLRLLMLLRERLLLGAGGSYFEYATSHEGRVARYRPTRTEIKLNSRRGTETSAFRSASVIRRDAVRCPSAGTLFAMSTPSSHQPVRRVRPGPH